MGFEIPPDILIFFICNNKIAVHLFYCIFRNQYCRILITFPLRIFNKYREFGIIQNNIYHHR